MTPISQAAVTTWLRTSGVWREVETIETHAALIFLVGERAFKMKKALNLGYLDFSTLERRHRILEREFVLNRRTAPDLYIGLVPVTRGDGGVLSIGGEGEAAEWLLEMKRFPDGALLSTMADHGGLMGDVIDRLAAEIAAFHDSTAVISGRDWMTAIERIASENSADLRGQTAVLSASAVESAIATRTAALDRASAALGEQSNDIRRCHGDLHLGNVFLDDGKPTLFDCIEFDDFYAEIPPLYDLSFLLMDLASRNFGELANHALNSWWVHRAPETWKGIMRSLAALPLYLSLRAEIRAKTLVRAPGGVSAAGRYLQLSEDLARVRPARLIAIGGLSGTGKSSVARSVAWKIGQRPGAIHLRSDQIRKRLRGLHATDRIPAAEYTSEAARRVYAEMSDLGALALTANHSVVMDAVFARPEERDAVAELARKLGVPFDGFWLKAPVSVLEGRIGRRRDDASDADVAVLHKQLSFDLGDITWRRVDAGGTLEETAAEIWRRLGVQSA